MSEFLQRIIEVLLASYTSEEDGYRCLSKWNVDVEQFVQTTIQKERHGSKTTPDETVVTHRDHESVIQIFASLQILLIKIAIGNTLNEARVSIVDGNQLRIDTNVILESLVYDYKSDTSFEKIQWSDMSVILRTAKNWWRWYIQLYLPSRRQYPMEIQERIARQDVETTWRSKRLLELLLNLLEKQSVTSFGEKLNENDPLRQGPQYVTQLFFYVTYPLSPNDLHLMDAYHYLITECHLMSRFLNTLTRCNSTMQLRLSIIRNVHNALASFPQTSMKAVNATKFEIPSDSEKFMQVKWIDYYEGNVITYKTFLRDLAFHILSYPDDDIPTETGYESSIISGELIVEILRCCYALRIGSDLDTDQKWQVVIEKVLHLDATKNDHAHDSKLAIICILMESATFRQYLSANSMESLLQVLEEQVTKVLREEYIDDRAAAALNPILAVLYKTCVECTDSFAEIIRNQVFPENVSDCEYDGSLVQTEAESPKNMSPIDAPEGSLRWKLIRLLTWPNSFVKRLTGELLFLLCHNKQQEFIRRVGIGNAVAILSLKGLIELPAAVHS